MSEKRRVYPAITWSESKRLFRASFTVGGKRRDVYGKSKDEVMDKIDILEAEAGRGVDSSMTFGTYAKRWCELKMRGLKHNTRAVYANALSSHILPGIGALPITKIKPLHIDEVMAALDGRSSSLRSKVLLTMSRIFESAAENELIRRNPCLGRKAGGIKAKEKTPLTKEQQAKLCGAVSGTQAGLFVLLCLYAGLRREEALGLLWSNVHLDAAAPYIDVRHTVTFDSSGNPMHSLDLKTSAAYRSIPVPPVLYGALAAAGTNGLFVIPSKNGGAMDAKEFGVMWRKTGGYAATGVEKDARNRTVRDSNGKYVRVKKYYGGAAGFTVTPHQLRHTYITELCASGLDIKKIQYLAGHSSVNMTLNVYSHVVNNRPDQLAPAVISAFDAGKSAGNESAGGV